MTSDSFVSVRFGFFGCLSRGKRFFNQYTDDRLKTSKNQGFPLIAF